MQSRFTKILSIILTLAILINLLPRQVLGAEFQSLSQTGTDNSDIVHFYQNQMGDPGTATIIGENKDARTQFSKEYLMSNGMSLAVVYPEAVHYEKNGQWEEIDNTLKTVGAGSNAMLTNTAGAWQVAFPSLLTGSNHVSITKDGYTLSFGLAGELRSNGELMSSEMGSIIDMIGNVSQEIELLITEANTVNAIIEELDLTAMRESMEYPETFVDTLFSKLRYENVYNNTDIEYDLNSSQVKESIILEAYDASLQGYRYTLNTGELIPVLEEDSSITLYAPDGETVIMTMPAPYLVDNNGVRNEDIEVVLQQEGESYVMYYQLPTEWLASEDLAWPVVLDPIISADGYCKNVQDQTVMENTTPSYTSGIIQAGYSTTNGKMRFFVKFTDLPTLTSADVIVHAQMKLVKPEDSGTTSAVNVHKVLGSWSSSTINWSNMPEYNTTIEDFAISKNAGNYYWDVTSIVQDWYTTGVNNGMMFKVPDSVEQGGTNSWKQFYSSDYSVYDTTIWPTLTIMYRNISGLESYWDYTANGAGRAGTGYINDYSGNLVWTRADVGFGGNLMPVSISHVYNTTDAQNNEFGLGNGWRTNYNQKAYKPSGSSYYVWEDGDGTKHYFNYDSEKSAYVDEDGLELTLTVLSSGVKIVDKNGNTSYFDSAYRLYKMENNQEIKSSINITYTDSTGFKISTIKDGVNRTYNFTYNSSGLLSKITYVGKGSSEITSVSYTYTGTNLTKVTDKDGKYSSYSYDSNNLLTAASDVDGYRLAYTYTATSPNRVASVTEYQDKDDGTSVLGGSLTITYAHNQTTFKDHNNNLQIMQFNDFGNTISIQDGEGRAEYAKYALNDYNDSADSANDNTLKANQLRLSSRMQNTVCNMQFAGNFESSVAWTRLNNNVTVSISSTAAYYGSKSMQITRSSAGAVSGAYGIPLNVEGQWPTLTFSAYIKTGAGANAFLAFADEDGNVYAASETIGTNQDWTRIEVSYAPVSSDGIKIFYPMVMTTNAGTIYVDCTQLEIMPTASRYNLLDYGDSWGEYFLMDAWVKSSGMTNADDVATSHALAMKNMDWTVLSITGDPQTEKYVSQTISQSGAAGDSYVLSGWAYGNSAPLSGYDTNERQFGLKVIFNNTDGSKTEAYVSFNSDIPTGDHWQYAATPAVAEKAYSSITVQAVYSYNVNTVYFDGLQLFKESFGSSYTYDEDGNLTSVIDLQNSITDYEYTSNNLTKILEDNKAKMRYEYDSWHNVIKAVTQTKDDSGNIVDGIVYEFEYDDYGNNTLVKVVNGDNTISTTATYTTDFNRMLTSTDDLANVTTYCYNENTNVLEWVQYPNDTETSRTTYTYDSMYRMATATAAVSGLSSGTALTASYTYTNDLLTEIETGSTTYSFSYGDFAQRSSIQIGSRTLASYTYTTDQNRYLDRLTYGNGDTVDYEYDSDGRVILETFEDGSTVSYEYDNTGALATMTDSKTGRKTTYYYDLTDRLMKYVESGTDYGHSVEYNYNTLNNLTWLAETINGRKVTSFHTYDSDNRLLKTEVEDPVLLCSTIIDYHYDDYGRIDDIVASYGGEWGVRKKYFFESPSDGKTSNRVTNYQADTHAFIVDFDITYDDNGNITSVQSGSSGYTYAYDSANQLIREDNSVANKTWVWTYDDAGNILSRKEYAYTTGSLGPVLDTVTYTYGDASWGDLLTAYDGVPITYDTIGNPLNDGTWTYTWRNGRELASMSNGSTTWNYTYDANGMRTSRSNGTTTYNYVYNGGQLTQMTVGNDTLYFIYDATGAPVIVLWNNSVYYYITSLQGDVLQIINEDVEIVATYDYDAWGNVVSVGGTMANTLGALNPLRYRSYIYDQETELYYLQSRYYNPEIGRFINADALVSTGQGLLGNNMFAYCRNNPVIFIDPSGEFGLLFAFVAATVVAGVANAISTAMSGGTVEECLVAGLIGGGSAAIGFGVAALTGFSPVGNVAARAVASTICDLGTTWYRNGEITGQDIATTAVDVTIDVCFSTVTYYYTDPIKDFGKQTLLNSSIDAGVDVLETKLFASQTQVNNSANAAKIGGSGGKGLVLGGNLHAKHIAFAY